MVFGHTSHFLWTQTEQRPSEWLQPTGSCVMWMALQGVRVRDIFLFIQWQVCTDTFQWKGPVLAEINGRVCKSFKNLRLNKSRSLGCEKHLQIRFGHFLYMTQHCMQNHFLKVEMVIHQFSSGNPAYFNVKNRHSSIENCPNLSNYPLVKSWSAGCSNNSSRRAGNELQASRASVKVSVHNVQ